MKYVEFVLCQAMACSVLVANSGAPSLEISS